MLRWPVVGWVWVPSIATTCLPSTSPSVSKVGPGPSDTNGTVTIASSTPKTTMGTSATIKVRIRLFTPLTLDGPRSGLIQLRAWPECARSVPAVSTVEVMADLPFGFSSGDDPEREKHGKKD